MYLIRKGHSAKVAHIWNGKDTVCRMYSTGGMNRSKFKQVVATSLPICVNCMNKTAGSLEKNGARVRKFTEQDVLVAINRAEKAAPPLQVQARTDGGVFAFVTSSEVWHAIMKQHSALLTIVKTNCTDKTNEVTYGIAGAAHPVMKLVEVWNIEEDPSKKDMTVEYWLYLPVPAKN